MNSQKFNFFLSKLSNKPLPVLDTNITLDKFIEIELSVKNKELLNFDISSSKEWENYITSYLKRRNSVIAFGG